MSDTPQKDQENAQVEQVEQLEQAADKISDLPDKAITDQDATAVKGGLGKTPNVHIVK
jgi:hypothetical protein